MIGALGLIRINVDPVPFKVGPVPIHWYGIAYAVAFLVAYRFAVVPHLTRRGVERDVIERGTVWTIVAGLVGARLYYVIQQPLGPFVRNPIQILAVWEGGMAFFGAIIAGTAAIALIAHRHRVSFWLLFDAGVLFAAVGQPIGRLGNLINGDILGPPSNAPWATAYTYVTAPDHCAVLQSGFQCGVGYQPAAAYEAIATLAILLLLLGVRRRGVADGVLAIMYVGAYALSQLVVFTLRASEPTVLWGLKQAQVTAIAVLVLGVPALIAVRIRQRRRDPKTGYHSRP